MARLPADLTAALRDVEGSAGGRISHREVAALQERYRGRRALGRTMTTAETRAYAGYRMPATYAAVAAVLGRLAATAAVAPRSLLDLGGGTGAASWAAAATFPGLERITVVDRDPQMLRLGRQLAERAGAAAVRDAAWMTADLRAGAPLPDADLAVLGYSLGELTPAEAAGALGRVIAAAPTVVVVEPGTPRGTDVVLAARAALIAGGRSVVAPCPHARDCPMAATADWCHFAVRLERSAMHRQAKGGSLGYEDEKFGYVAATAAATAAATMPAGGRIVRHPLHRKGHTVLRVCTAADGLADVTVSRRHGAAYRAARAASWGDPWPAAITGEPVEGIAGPGTGP